MTISEITRQGLHYARTCQSLWLFGFVVGMASGGSGGGGGRAGSGWSLGAGGVAVSIDRPLSLSVGQLSLIVLALVLAIVLLVVRFVSEGALIEGIARAHRGGTMTTREGFRSGLAHWVVLVQIALLYFAATLGSLLLLAAPGVIALQAFGPLAGIALGMPALAVGVPWLVTLYLVQAFASQIAVLENRHALDAIGKARLFLHGRLMHGLKLLVAMLLGTLLIAGICIAVVLPVTLNEEDVAGAWTTLEPTYQQRRRMERRVTDWLEARDQPLAAEWLGLFRMAPFATPGLAALSALSVVTATPLAWFAFALI